MNEKEIKAAEAAVELNREQLEEIDGGKTIRVKKSRYQEKEKLLGQNQKENQNLSDSRRS